MYLTNDNLTKEVKVKYLLHIRNENSESENYKIKKLQENVSYQRLKEKKKS